MRVAYESSGGGRDFPVDRLRDVPVKQRTGGAEKRRNLDPHRRMFLYV
jgi:hypothetical protein